MSLLGLVAEIATGYSGAASGDPISACRSFAQRAGAEDILIFCFDPEVQAFLPTPPFAQTLPNSPAWQRFIRSLDEDGGSATLPSPYRANNLRPVQGRRVDSHTVVALLGKETPINTEGQEFWTAARLLGRFFSASHQISVAEARARLAGETARVNGEIAASLLATRKKLEGSLAETRKERHKLRQSNERLQLAQQIASMGLWQWDRSLRTLDLSPEMLIMCGLDGGSPESSLLHVLHALDAAGRAAVRTAIARASRTGQPSEVEVHLRLDGGAVRWISSRLVAGSDEAGHRVVTGVSLDLTERRQSEEALRRSEALASAGRMAATIAHEINNPLESVTNLLYILSTDDELPPRLREIVTGAEQEIARVSSIARQTLTYYHDNSAPADVDISELLRETVELYNSRLRRFAVRIDSNIPEEFRLRAFRGELKQLFSNLLANSIDALNESGNGSGSLTFAARAQADSVCVSLADSGAGIAPQNLVRIFQPFFTTKNQHGTGLGLWISEGIAKKHGGRIEVESSTDPDRHGTTVHVFLSGIPRHPAP